MPSIRNLKIKKGVRSAKNLLSFSTTMRVLSHNTIRGAAGGAILNAELLVKNGLLS